MSEFWTATVSGFLDMREAHGPFWNLGDAERDAAQTLPTFERNGLRAPTDPKLGDWFVVHRDSPIYSESMTMVDGPWETRERAEQERQSNIADPQTFDCDCGLQRGFVAQVVTMLPHHRAVLVRG